MDPARIEGKVLKIRSVDLSKLKEEHAAVNDEDCDDGNYEGNVNGKADKRMH